MDKILSQDEIDALLATVVGELKEKGIQDSDSSGSASNYDFNSPNLIPRDQMRLLVSVHEELSRKLGVYFAGRLNVVVDVNLLTVEQLKYSDFMVSIAPPSSIYVCNVSNSNSCFILDMAPQFCVFMVEKLLGGQGDPMSYARQLSNIEQTIMQRIMGEINSEISKAWAPIDDYSLKVDRYDHNPEFVQIYPAMEPVVVAAIEIKIHGNASLMSICYPFNWISQKTSSKELQDAYLYRKEKSSPEEKQMVVDGILDTPVLLRVVLGEAKITINEFIKLQKDDVIKLNTNIDEQVQVLVDKKNTHRASIGTSRQKYACRIEGKDNRNVRGVE